MQQPWLQGKGIFADAKPKALYSIYVNPNKKKMENNNIKMHAEATRVGIKEKGLFRDKSTW